MAFPTIEYQNMIAVQRFANGLYDVQVGSETMDQVLSEISEYGMDTVFNSYYDFTFADDAAAATAIVANLGIDAALVASAEAYVADVLGAAGAAKGVAAYNILVDFAGFESDATFGAAATAWNAEIDVAMAYEGSADVAPGTENPIVTDFVLSSGIDNLSGSAADDMFDAPLSQNYTYGGVSNTLSSGDSLDGGAGEDLLNAVLVPEFYGVTGEGQVDVQPTIAGIETIQLEVQDVRFTDYDDNWDNLEGDEAIVFDAKDVTGVDSIGSYYSDGDLIIENLTTLTDAGVARNTDAITITMDHTDNFNHDDDAADLSVYFDEDYLLSGETAEAAAFYWLLDEDAELNGLADRLDRINVDGLRFSVGDDPTQYLLSDPDAQTAGTHQGFIDSLQDELAALILNGTLPEGTTLTLDPTNTDTTGLDDGSISATIPAMVLTSGDGTVITPLGFSQVADALGNYDVYGQFGNESDVANNPVAINVELEKVGRDNDGGDLFIGGKHDEGIPDFYVSVLGNDDQPSDLGSINTNENDMKNVFISTAAADQVDYDGDGDVDNDDVADLFIRDAFDNQDGLDLVNANDFLGDLNIGEDRRATDIETFTATGGGDVTLREDIDASGADFRIITGAGEDDIDVTLDGDAVDTIGESFSVSTGSADDQVTVDMQGANVSRATTAALNNLSITTGSGNDAVTLIGGFEDGEGADGDADFNISTGSGTDFVYINSRDDVDSADAGLGSWDIHDSSQGVEDSDNDDSTGLDFSDTADRTVLYNATVTVMFAGHENTVSLETTAANNFIATAVQMNDAIMAAIDTDADLSRLLDYTLDTGIQQLQIDSTVEGLNDLTIGINQADLEDVSADLDAGEILIQSSDVAALAAGLRDVNGVDSDTIDTAAEVETAFNVDIAALEATADAGDICYLETDEGTDGTNETNVTNISVIDLGTGSNDLVVLNSHDGSANTVDFTAAWGDVSIINWFTDQSNDDDADNQCDLTDATSGNHILDFTAWLDDMNDPSATVNDDSAVRVATTVRVDNAANISIDAANEVIIINDFAEGADATETYANLSASDIEGVIEGATLGADTLYGNLDNLADDGSILNTDFNMEDTDTTDAIIMIENDDAEHQGEYKVFNIDSDNRDTTEDVTVTYLGIIDFGESIDTAHGLLAANFA